MRWAWTCLMVLLFAGVAFAAQDAEAVAGVKFDWNNLWQMAIAGALSSALLGGGKNGKFNPKEWKWDKMGQKAIIGVVVGAIAGWKGISLASAETFMFEGDALGLGSMLVFGLDYLLKAIFKGSAISVKKLKAAADNAANPS